MIYAKFVKDPHRCFISFSSIGPGVLEERSFKFDQSKHVKVHGSHFVSRTGIILCKLCKNPSIDATYQVSDHLVKRFYRKSFLKFWPIRKRKCSWRPFCFINPDDLCKICTGPPIDAPYKKSVHLAYRFQRKRSFKFWPIRKRKCQWRPFCMMEQDDLCKLCKGPSIDAPYKKSVHLAYRFQRKRSFKFWPIRKRKYPWRPFCITDRDDLCKFCKGPSIDAPYKKSVRLA